MRASMHFSWAVLVVVVVLGVFLTPAPGDLLEDPKQNYSIEIPYGWTALPENPAWKKLGIVVGGVRPLDKLKSGKPGQGEGGQLHLAITDLPEGKTLDDMAADTDVKGFLLKRFGDNSSSWPELETASDEDPETGLPYRILTCDGKAPNLEGKKSAVRAVLVLTVAKKKLFKLRMYGWHTEFDEEGIKGDLDVIETNFIIIDPTDDPVKESEGERPPPSEDEEEEAPTGDMAEEKVLENLKQGWRITKPVGIRSKEFDETKWRNVVAWFEDNNRYGSYQIMLYVIPRARQKAGQTVPDQQLKPWGLDKWYMRFEKDHPTGPIRTWKFPKRPKGLLLLPDPDSMKDVFATVLKRPKDPKKVDGSDLIKKYKCAEKIKGARVGDEKCIEAYRAVLGGNRERSGREMVVRYLWGTPFRTCMLVVSFSREGYKKWGEPVQTMISSIEMTGRAR